MAGKSVKMMEGTEDDTLGSARKALMLSKIATFRVAKTPTLKVA